MKPSSARAALALATALVAPAAQGDVPLPPWVADGEVPPPSWAQSVEPKPGERGELGDMVLFAEPTRASDRRGVTALSGLPMDAYRGKPFRSLVLDTFDRLSAPVEHRYVWKELAPWFSETGMEVDAARDETGWFILARKPKP